MSHQKTKEDVIQNKKKAIKSVNKMLENLINDSSEKHLKKANLISYWIQDYVRFTQFEEKFNPTRLLSYKRGDVIRVNFGFRVGAEFGGLHYAVVLDKENPHNSNTLTVVPLSSLKADKAVHERDLSIGTEFYNLVDAKFKRQFTETKNKLDELSALNSVLRKIPEDQWTAETLAAFRNIDKQIDEILNTISSLAKDQQEIEKMKVGSIVKIEQITTISKMRIYTPKKSADFLSGIRLSSNAMSRINEKIKEFYIFSE